MNVDDAFRGVFRKRAWLVTVTGVVITDRVGNIDGEDVPTLQITYNEQRDPPPLQELPPPCL